MRANIRQSRSEVTGTLIFLLPIFFLAVGTLTRFWAFRHMQPETHPSAYFDAMCWWDCHWYVLMAEKGYDAFPSPTGQDAVNWAFFPLYPTIVGFFSKFVPLPTLVVGSLISLVTAYAAVIAAWPFMRGNLRSYALYAAYVLSGPFSFYFTTFFTEVMFLLLTTLVFRKLDRSNYLGAAIVAALLSATRIVGVFASVAIGVQALSDYYRAHRTWRGMLRGLLGQPGLVLAVFVAPVGCFAYIAYLHFSLGDGLAFSHVQRAWGRELENPFAYLRLGLLGETNGRYGQVLALATLFALALTVVLTVRRRWAEAVFCMFCIFVPLTAGLGSMLRFIAAQAPLVILSCTLLGQKRWTFTAGMVCLQLGAWYVTLAWLGGNNVLV